jgi:hypothetical protein
MFVRTVTHVTTRRVDRRRPLNGIWMLALSAELKAFVPVAAAPGR